MERTKLSFEFTAEDVKILNKIKAWMAVKQGTVSNIAAIRAAIREMVKNEAIS